VTLRPGASEQLGLALLKSAPDGYTIGIGQGGNLSVAPHTYKKVPYVSSVLGGEVMMGIGSYTSLLL
jgi:hypothetical protein